MRGRSALPFLSGVLLALGLSGCGEIFVASPKLPRAFEQQELADLLIRFHTWDDFAVHKPPRFAAPEVMPPTRHAFVAMLEQYRERKNLAVVVFDARLASRQQERAKLMNDLANILKHFGFARVVFQQAAPEWTPAGLPILRDL